MKIPLKRQFAFLIGLWVLTVISYSGSLTASWHLDDISNIVRNAKIHPAQLDAVTIVDTFFAGATGKLYRPAPMASFALNWYHGGAAVTGYHVINILIHCINSFLLYLVVLHLLRTPRMSGIYSESETLWVALLATLFWALNPVQTQAVTYIVQRMASMAGLFFLIGIYLFLRYKNTTSVGLKIALITAIVSAYLLAILSKENAALFPISLFLIEIIFFASVEPPHPARNHWILAASLLFFTLLVGTAVFILIRDNPIQFVENLYTNRPFTGPQRLLTEPRVLFFYLSQLFFPLPSRLSLCHDIDVSTALFEPWTTLPAILSVCAIVCLCIANYKKKPLASFAFLFFFLNHGVESTILPLELVFEHRNYLPTFFLFLPLAHSVIKWNRHPFFSTKNGRYLAVGSIGITIFLLCNWTFARNLTWQSEKSLWEDEISKNPKLARPYHNLAWGYHQARGQYTEALDLYEKALTMKYHSNYEVAITLGNIGRIHFIMGDYDQALQFFVESIKKHPQPKIVETQMAMAFIQQQRWPEALKFIDSALQVDERDPMYLKLKGIVMSKVGDDDQAASLLSRSLKADPEKTGTRVHLSMALSRMGRLDEARSLFGDRNTIGNRNPQVLMALAEIERKYGSHNKSDEYFNQVVTYQGIEKVTDLLVSWRKDNLSIDIDCDYYLTRIDQFKK